MWQWRDAAEAKDLIEFCGRVGTKVLLIEQPPKLHFGDRTAVQYLASVGLYPRGSQRVYIRSTDRTLHAKGIETVRSLCRKYPFCQSIPVSDLFDLENQWSWVLDGSRVLYIDDDHLSEWGAEKAKDRIREALRTALSSS